MSDPVSEISTSPAIDAAIVTRDPTRRFGDLLAVANVSLTISPGEIFGLIGANGAGKSTLIKMLTTLLAPSSGAAWIAGFDIVTQAAKVRRHIGYVQQLVSADGSLTGYENMLLSARLYAIPRGERSRRISEAPAAMNLSDVADRLVQHYSGGMIRELEIAQSMLHRPQVMFMDEPTVGLDPLARRNVHQRIHLLCEKFGMTMFITTHDMSEIEELSDRIALMHQGRIAVVDTPKELKAQVGSGATLEDVFAHFMGGKIEAGGGYTQTRVARRSAKKWG